MASTTQCETIGANQFADKSVITGSMFMDAMNSFNPTSIDLVPVVFEHSASGQCGLVNSQKDPYIMDKNKICVQ